MRMAAGGWGFLGLLSMLWGGTFFFTSLTVNELPPLTVVFLRVLIAALALFSYLKILRIKLPFNRPAWIAFFTMGLLNNVVPFSLFFWAQTTIPGGLASIVNASTPIFSILIAHMMLKDESFTLSRFVGVSLAFLGVSLLFYDDVNDGFDLATLGLLACLLAAVCQGFAVVYGRRFEALGVSSSVSALGQLVGTSIIMFPAILVIDRPWSLETPSYTAFVALIAMALLSTALAYLIFFRLLANVGAVNASLVTLLIPVSAIFLGAMFLGERLASTDLAGLGLIFLGLLVIDGRMLLQSKG